MALLPSGAQQLPEVLKPTGPIFYRSYRATTVGTVSLHNSLAAFTTCCARVICIRQRRMPSRWRLSRTISIWRCSGLICPTPIGQAQRAEAGGPIRGLSTGAPNVGATDAGVGVNGAIQSAGVSSGGGGGAGFVGGGGGGANNQQIGPVVVKFDPAFSGSTTLSHLTYPQSNLAVSQTNPLVDVNHIYIQTLSQGLATGGTVQYTNYSYSQRENAPTDTLNPAFGPYMRVLFQQPLLQNYGVKLNTRSIRVARNGVVMARETFRANLLNLVNTVLSQYWGLVTANQELKARQQALENTRKFRDDTEREINAGAAAGGNALRRRRAGKPCARCDPGADDIAAAGDLHEGATGANDRSGDRGGADRAAR